MKIALIVTDLGMGGAENVVINLADKFAEAGHEVMIAYLTGNLELRPLNKEINIFDARMKSKFHFIPAYFRLRKAIQIFQPDVVHSHMVHANIITRLLRLSLKIPRVISTVHSVYEGGKLRTLACRLTDPLADISTSICEEAVVASIERGAVRRDKIICIPNGIDIDKFKFDLDSRNCIRRELDLKNKYVFLAAGRLDTAKDFKNLIIAVSKLTNKNQNFTVLIAGDGPLKQELESLAKTLGVDEFIKLLGLRRDMPQLLSASDAFVLSSAWEGLPLVIEEAMACERHIVATDCGGVKEVVGELGIIVPTKNSDALYLAMAEAIALEVDNRSILGKKAREKIQKVYSLDAIAERYLQLYSTTTLSCAKQ